MSPLIQQQDFGKTITCFKDSRINKISNSKIKRMDKILNSDMIKEQISARFSNKSNLKNKNQDKVWFNTKIRLILIFITSVLYYLTYLD